MKAAGRSIGPALTDQAIVSAASFVTTALLGRLAGPVEFGLFSLAIALALLTAGVQESLITLPYTVFSLRMLDTDRRLYAGSSLVLSALLTMVAAATGAMCLALSALGLLPRSLMAPIALWMAVTPAFLLRELARRFLFAGMRAGRVLVLDLGVTSLQLALLLLLVWYGGLSASGVVLVVVLASSTGGIVWLAVTRRDFRIARPAIEAALRRNWTFGRWVLADRVLSMLNSDILLLWMTALLVGRTATGVVAACLTAVRLSNPFVLGIGNFMTPRVAQAYVAGGRDATRRAAMSTTWVLCGPLSVFCVLMWLFGNTGLRAVYGASYVGHDMTVTVLALGFLSGAAGIGAANGLMTLSRPQLNVLSSTLGLTVTLLAITALAPRLGILGAAVGLLLGLTMESLSKIVLFAYSLRTHGADVPGAPTPTPVETTRS